MNYYYVVLPPVYERDWLIFSLAAPTRLELINIATSCVAVCLARQSSRQQNPSLPWSCPAKGSASLHSLRNNHLTNIVASIRPC